MTAQPVERRVAKLEGSFGQMNHRIGSMDSRMEAGFARVERKIDGNFKTLIGWMLGCMVGQTGVIVGAIVAVAFASRH